VVIITALRKEDPGLGGCMKKEQMVKKENHKVKILKSYLW
jgi:hypothetical protein